MQKILDDKLFSTNEIIANLKGFTHDNGSSWVGSQAGLASLLKQRGSQFFDLNDLIKSQDEIFLREALILSLPSQISIHPSKRAVSKRVQDENKLSNLYLMKLGITRWLSLGKALTRLIDIWEPLYIFQISDQRQKINE